jgi:hypothetical protein
MAQSITLPVIGNLGNIEGPATDGVLIGQLTATDPETVLVKVSLSSGLCITDDGGTYVDETTPAAESTGDDVEVLPATPAVEDACYFGLAGDTFAQVDCNITTQGAGTWTIVWEYWDGAAWTALTGVTDNTTGFTATTGWKTVPFTLPVDWAQNTVDNVLAYWVRARVSAYTSVTTAPQLGQVRFTPTATSSFVDETTDFTSAAAGDVNLLPEFPTAGDGVYIGHSEKFCKVKVTTSQALTGTATHTLEYWNGTVWGAVTTYEDDTAGWATTAGTLYIHFVPPTDWVANTAANGPNGQTGFFVFMKVDGGTVTQQPQATQGWVLPLTTGADGVQAMGSVNRVICSAGTASATNADSIFILVNTTRTTFEEFTWAKGDVQDESVVDLVCAAADKVALVQITEDGTTEFADANFILRIS